MAESTNGKNTGDNVIWLVLGFTSLGLLVGSIAGLSSAQLTLPLFGFLFALVGGSVIAFLDKVPRQSLGLAGIALASFSLAGAISLYGGLFIKVNELLYLHGNQAISVKPTASIAKPPDNTVAAGYRDLMRSREGQRLEDYLKEEVASGNIDLATACGRLSESVSTKPRSSK